MDKKMLSEMLETAIDTHGLEWILYALSIVCGDKAAHIEQNYPKDKQIKQWDKAGTLLELTSTKVAKIFEKPA